LGKGLLAFVLWAIWVLVVLGWLFDYLVRFPPFTFFRFFFFSWSSFFLALYFSSRKWPCSKRGVPFGRRLGGSFGLLVHDSFFFGFGTLNPRFFSDLNFFRNGLPQEKTFFFLFFLSCFFFVLFSRLFFLFVLTLSFGPPNFVHSLPPPRFYPV